MMRRLVDCLSEEQVDGICKSLTDKNPLKVATVCSGTDAPILALQVLLSVLNEKKNVNIEMDHVFSCESVPFKRDFIERTTNPPLLFKDLIQLASGVGECHDGVTGNVPEEFTILIAGTECVDFSSLSTTPKGLNDKGRSSTTFYATVELTKRRMPPIVILENVAKCPVKEMERAFEDIGYDAAHCKVCTSDYLLPQSRKRTYILFVQRDTTRATDCDWVQLMRQMGPERSQPSNEKKLEWMDFLHNDGRYTVSEPSQRQGKKRRRGGKPLSESLNAKRLAEIKAIEAKEGLTPYDANGGRPYTAATVDCAKLASLPDRAKMRLDVQYKRAVKSGIDPTTTPLLWNPAQQLGSQIRSLGCVHLLLALPPNTSTLLVHGKLH